MKTISKKKFGIFIVIALTVFLHIWAVSLLPQDFDEPVYIQNGFDYAKAIQEGNLNAVIDYPEGREHPALVKILYSGGILALGKHATWTNAFFTSRSISALFGILAVLIVTIGIDPLAGGLLAVHTLAVKYTSQAYLEALPHFMTIAAVLAFLKIEKGKTNRWFWFSAVALGMATAGKYTYTPVIVLAYLAIFEKKTRIHWLFLYALLALAAFFACDVTLWHDPINRLIQSLSFHVQYSQGAHVQEVGYPWYQPFIWIFTSSPASWHPNVFFYYGFDGIFTILALLGLKREWKNRRWLVVWLGFGMLFLLLWPTKWPQYALILTPALCIMGAETARRFWHWIREKETYWDYLREMLPVPSKWLWISIGIFALFIAAIYLSAEIKMAIGRIGWSHMTPQNSSLPGFSVNDLLVQGDNSVIIATDRGAAIYTLSTSSEHDTTWTIINQENSGLPDNQVLSLARDSQGILWFGTSRGLVKYDGTSWTSFHENDLQVESDEIISLAADQRGNIFAGTLSGGSFWNGEQWTSLNQYLSGQPVWSLLPSGNTVWAGTSAGVWNIDLSSLMANYFPTTNPVLHLISASDGTIWAATSGSGLAQLLNGNWKYFTISNSGIPTNTVNWVTEIKPGLFWVATSFPSAPGGIIASFDGTNWYSYLTSNSGASGFEPLEVVPDEKGQIWIGTRGGGIDLYRLGR